MPVSVAVGSVAIRAGPCIVVEPCDVDLGEGRGRPEGLRNPLRLGGVYGIALPVARGGALDDDVPALPGHGATGRSPAVGCLTAPCAGRPPGATSSVRLDGDRHATHGGATIPVVMRSGYDIRSEPGSSLADPGKCSYRRASAYLISTASSNV